MNKTDKAKLAKWCRVCATVFKKRRNPLSDLKLREEIASFHNRKKNSNSLHSKMEELDDHELDMWGTMNHPYDKTQEKPEEVLKAEAVQQVMTFNNAVMGKEVVLPPVKETEYVALPLPWEK